MEAEAALRAGRAAGLATVVIGPALLIAPHRVGVLSRIGDTRTARGIGLVDLVLAPGLLFAAPRWPWVAARALANVGTAVVVARGGCAGRSAAAGFIAATLVDGQAARTLHALGR